MIQTTSAILIVLGAIFILIGCIGIVKMPNVFCRAHALIKAHTLGLSLILAGAWIQIEQPNNSYVLLISLFLLFVTIPITGHFISLANYRKKTKLKQVNK